MLSPSNVIHSIFSKEQSNNYSYELHLVRSLKMALIALFDVMVLFWPYQVNPGLDNVAFFVTIFFREIFRLLHRTSICISNQVISDHIHTLKTF